MDQAIIDNANISGDKTSACQHLSENKARVTEAVKAAHSSGNITPLLKEELWCTIQLRRLSRGCEEIRVEETEDTKPNHTMTIEDLNRICLRKDQNRRAARKYREKKKKQQGDLKQEIEKLQDENEVLKKEIIKLQSEKVSFEETLYEHLKICPMLYTDRTPIEFRVA